MSIIQPGSTLGILGSGQLGRMFVIAAKQMGYRVHVLSPDADSPAGQVADREFVADDNDAATITEFAKSVEAATIEFENIPISTIELAEQYAPVRPGSGVLRCIQNRIDEKSMLTNIQVPVPKFRAVRTEDDLQAVSGDSYPAVLKTASTGYDGKGQRIVQSSADLHEAWKSLGQAECVLEAFVEFDCEFSVIAARGSDGQMVCYQPILNHHQNHILDISISPGDLPESATLQATEMIQNIAQSLDYVGVLCVEFFLLPSGDACVNEIAPRPHNSGHLTIEAHATSQFQQQVRAVCGLPLGSTEQKRPAAMANLLGDCWQGQPPNWKSMLAHPNAALHLYGKAEARVGRKMGHITCLSETTAAAAEYVRRARASLDSHDDSTAAASHTADDAHHRESYIR